MSLADTGEAAFQGFEPRPEWGRLGVPKLFSLKQYSQHTEWDRFLFLCGLKMVFLSHHYVQ